MALATSSRARPYWFNALGSSDTRTAGSELPPACTWPTPGICASFCAMIVEATSKTWPGVSESEVSASARIGACEGFTFRYCGMPGMPLGSCARDALIAACTSRAAASTSRPSSKRSSTWAEPWVLEDVISLSPGMVPSARSSGVATVAAIDSGLAPGRLALMLIAG